jgi:hypothetical protein
MFGLHSCIQSPIAIRFPTTIQRFMEIPSLEGLPVRISYSVKRFCASKCTLSPVTLVPVLDSLETAATSASRPIGSRRPLTLRRLNLAKTMNENTFQCHECRVIEWNSGKSLNSANGVPDPISELLRGPRHCAIPLSCSMFGCEYGESRNYLAAFSRSGSGLQLLLDV